MAKPSKKITVTRPILYYFAYSFLFFLIHLSSISVVSFFHFLIDHDMHVIENWLSSYAWQIVIFSKALSLIIILTLFDLNHFEDKSTFKRIKSLDFKPSFKASIFIIFIFVFYFSLIVQFGKGIEINKSSTSFFYLSYLGSIFYYWLDFLLISMLAIKTSFKSWRGKSLFCLITMSLFVISTKVILPYKSAHTFLVMIHFMTLMALFLKEKTNLINSLLYCILVIGPLSSLFGFDLIWENIHSLYIYKKELPVIGIFGVWLIGIIYYSKATKIFNKTRLP